MSSAPAVSSVNAPRRVVVSELAETPPEAIDRFVALVPQAEPTLETLGAHEVVVAIKSASVGWVDLLMTSGQYQHLAKPPYTPGLEYAGLIRNKGTAVRSALSVGEPVLVDPFLAGPRSLGAYQSAGGWASFAVVPEDAVVPVPRGLSLDEACNLLGNYETAYHCLLTRGRLARDETVLVLGATGATGLAAVQIAKHRGATVIAVGRSMDKLLVVKANGADHVLSLAEADGGATSLRDRVRDLTGGRGVDVVYDGVGGPLSTEALRCLVFGGRFLVVGWASTPFVAKGKGGRGAPNVNLLPTNLVLMKSIDVLGCPTAIATAHDPTLRPARLAHILAWAAEGHLKPHVSCTFDLGDIHEAMRAKWSGAVVGGCVVHP
jgi:NADPH2:quinone reductase